MIGLQYCVLGIFLLVIIYFDLRYRRIPNRLLLTVLVLQSLWFIYFVNSSVQAPAPFINTSWTNGLLVFAFTLLVFSPLWRFRAMGAGDVKFFAVLGFCIGASGLISALIIGSILAGLHAIAAVLLQGWTGATAVWRLAPDVRRGIPYAAYVALGALFGIGWLAFNTQPWLKTLLDS